MKFQSIADFPPDSFRRQDEHDDEMFYQDARKVVHIDDAAIEAVRGLYRDTLPDGGRVLDLMGSWRSHLPDDGVYEEVVGLGMNADEMSDNPQLNHFILQNLNKDPQLPFEDESFHGAICSVSVQYMVQPVEVFREVGRVLKQGGPFVVIFSNRCFPMKAVHLWCHTTDDEHAQIVRTYFRESEWFTEIEVRDISPGPSGDPVYAALGRRR